MKKKIGKRSYHHGNLKVALVQAALKVIESEGIEALSLREIASLVGTSHTAPYRHFQDKNELLAAVAEEGFRALNRQMKDVIQKNNPLKDFQKLGITYVLFATENSASFRAMYARELEDKSRYPSLLQASQETFHFMELTIQRCQQEGLMGEFRAEEIALSAWSIVHGLSNLINNGQLLKPFSVKKLAQLVTQVLARGFLSTSVRKNS